MMAEVELNHPNRSNREINASAVLLMQLCVRLQFSVVKYVRAIKIPHLVTWLHCTFVPILRCGIV